MEASAAEFVAVLLIPVGNGSITAIFELHDNTYVYFSFYP